MESSKTNNIFLTKEKTPTVFPTNYLTRKKLNKPQKQRLSHFIHSLPFSQKGAKAAPFHSIPRLKTPSAQCIVI
jgi:hypothetical protein